MEIVESRLRFTVDRAIEIKGIPIRVVAVYRTAEFPEGEEIYGALLAHDESEIDLVKQKLRKGLLQYLEK